MTVFIHLHVKYYSTENLGLLKMSVTQFENIKAAVRAQCATYDCHKNVFGHNRRM